MASANKTPVVAEAHLVDTFRKPLISGNLWTTFMASNLLTTVSQTPHRRCLKVSFPDLAGRMRDRIAKKNELTRTQSILVNPTLAVSSDFRGTLESVVRF